MTTLHHHAALCLRPPVRHAGVLARALATVAAAVFAACAPAAPSLTVAAALDVAMRYVARQGVTSVHHVGGWGDLAVFRRARAAGRVKTRVYAAVTRRTLDDRNPGGWVPEQKITVEEALRAYTATAACASFEEGLKGTLETGKLADLVILDRDIRRVPPEAIRDARGAATIVGGEVVFQSDSPH